MYTFREDIKNVDTYLDLRQQVGWVALSRQQAQIALDHSLKIYTVYDQERAIGMGRIVGDGAVVCYIQDLIVLPPYQKQHLGSMIIDKMITYVESLMQPGTRIMLCLMSAKGSEVFYQKHGFVARPTQELGAGMIRYIRKEN